jgi:hypothetical protein
MAGRVPGLTGYPQITRIHTNTHTRPAYFKRTQQNGGRPPIEAHTYVSAMRLKELEHGLPKLVWVGAHQPALHLPVLHKQERLGVVVLCWVCVVCCGVVIQGSKSGGNGRRRRRRMVSFFQNMTHDAAPGSAHTGICMTSKRLAVSEFSSISTFKKTASEI